MRKTDSPANRGMVHVYTGDGKGKTTAAFGLVLRALGAGWPVFVAQFLKGRPGNEVKALERFAGQVEVCLYGRPGFVLGEPAAPDIALARAGLERVERVFAEGHRRMVVLDEASTAVSLKLFPIEDLLGIVAGKPQDVELVITGRRAHPRLVERADLVTEMKLKKHYFDQGVQARGGVEY